MLLFLLDAFEICMKFTFGLQISIHIWCDYSILKAWYILLNTKNVFFSKDNYFYMHFKLLLTKKLQHERMDLLWMCASKYETRN